MNVDGGLDFSCPQIKETLIKDIKELICNVDILDMEPYPSPHTLAMLASAVYTDGVGELPRDWEYLTTAFNKSWGNGYFGAAYWNPSLQQVVISHRGTIVSNTGAMWTNYKGVVKTNYPSQINSAITFADKIMTVLNEVNKENGVSLQLSITGHSLGGWLAQITAYSLKYKHRIGDKFSEIQNRLQRCPHHRHVHTVTFDTPGCGDMLKRIIDDGCDRYGKVVSPNQLDITNYLAPPNRINTTGSHVGTIYRVSLDISEFGFKEKKTAWYNVAIHAINNFVKAFKDGVTICEVLDWPRGSEECGDFHALTSFEMNYIPVPIAELNTWKRKLRYKTENTDYSCNLRVFAENELNLLDFLLTIKEHGVIIMNEINAFLSQHNLGKASSLFAQFKKDNHTVSCISEKDLKSVIRHTKVLMRWFHAELTKEIRRWSEQKANIIFSILNRRYLNSLPVCTMNFRDTLGLEDFLVSSERRILHIQTENGEFEVARVFKLISQMSQLEHLDKYLSQDRLMYVSWSCIVDLEWSVNIENLYKSANSPENLLIVDCAYPAADSPDLERGEIFKRFIMINCDKKIIFITSAQQRDMENFLKSLNVSVRGVLKVCPCKLRSGDLTKDAQKELFTRKMLIVCGIEVSLADYAGIQNLTFLSYMDTFIDTQMFRRVVTDPTYTVEMENPFTTQNNLFLHSIVNTVVSVTRVARVLRAHPERTVLVMSGVSREELETEERWRELKNITVVTTPTSEEGILQFNKMCWEEPASTVYWMTVSAETLHFKQIYSNSFYMERRFNNPIVFDLKKFVQQKHIDGLFIFQNVTDKKSLIPVSLRHSDIKVNLFLENENIKTTASVAEYQSIRLNCDKPVHILRLEENGQCLWQKSQGSLDGLRPFVNATDTSGSRGEKELCRSEQKVVIIADEPGMGKSTSLTSMSRLLQSAWVIRVDLKDFKSPIANLPSVLSMDSVIEFLLRDKSTANSPLCGILQFCLDKRTENSRRVYLFFDGFDEIKEDCSSTNNSAQNNVLRLFKYLNTETAARLWISTRLYMKEILENELSTFAMMFEKISETQQKKYLVNLWHAHLLLELENYQNSNKWRLEMCARELYEEARKLGNNIESFMGIPLQMRMLAEVYLQRVKQVITENIRENITSTFKVESVVSLYQQFISHKYEIFFDAKTNLNANMSYVLKESMGKTFTKHHIALSFRTLFPKFSDEKIVDIGIEWRTELSRVGLVQSQGDGSENIEFIHRTLAEFFCADVAADWLNGLYCERASMVQIITEILLLDSNKVIRIFLNNFLQLRPLSDIGREYTTSELRKHWNINPHSLIDQDHTTLELAASEGHLLLVEYLVKMGENVNTTNKEGKTALSSAAQKGHNLVVELLVDMGADINSTDVDNRTALSLAAHMGYNLVVKLLVERGANITSRDVDGRTALSLAAKGGYGLVVELLLNEGADINSKDKVGKTSLSLAAQEGRNLVVELLVNRGADINCTDKDGKTALSLGAQEGDNLVVELLIDMGANINSRDNDGKTALSLAAEMGHHLVLELLVNEGADINSTDKYGRTALSLAAEDGHYLVVELLVNMGANINSPDKDGRTALFFSAGMGYDLVVKLLVDKGADINYTDRYGMTALTNAEDMGHDLVVALLVDQKINIAFTDVVSRTTLSLIDQNRYHLVDNGADINSIDKDGRTALSLAAQEGDNRMVKLLIDKGADINCKDKDYRTALSLAAQQGKNRVVKLLIDKGADINSTDKDGRTALSLAALEDEIRVVKLLIDKRADINSIDNDGRTALSLAAQRGQILIVKLLVDKGADINSKDKDGNTALSLGAREGDNLVVELLIDMGADINSRDNDGRTALSLAARDWDYRIVKSLIDKGADMNSKNKDGRTALALAALEGDYRIVQLLIDKGADMNSKDKDGKTSLSLAARDGDYRVVKLLIDKGADINSTDKDGKTALSLSFEWGHKSVVELLVGMVADVNSTDKDGRAALSLAAQWGFKLVVELLVDKGADINYTDMEGRTALSLAAEEGHYLVVELLVGKGAGINYEDKKGRTALSLAAKEGHILVVVLLISKGGDINSTDKEGKTTLSWMAINGHLSMVKLLLQKGADVNSIDMDGWSALYRSFCIRRADRLRVMWYVFLLTQNRFKQNANSALPEEKKVQTRHTSHPTAAVFRVQGVYGARIGIFGHNCEGRSSSYTRDMKLQ